MSNLKVIFDKSNPEWRKDQELNMMFINSINVYYTDILKKSGFVSLGDVLRDLGFPSVQHTKEQRLAGWVLGKVVIFYVKQMDDSIEIDFDATNVYEKKEKCTYCREKLTGYQNSDFLDVPINLFNGRSLGRMTLYINEKDRLSMDLYNSYDDPLITSDIGIRYCPMCGRRID